MAGVYEFVVGLKDNFSVGFTRLNQGLGSSINQAGGFTFAMNNVNTALGSFGTQFNTVIAPGIEFEKNMKEVQAITGVAGMKLNELGANARKLAEDFGGTASTGLESYKIILSKLDPELAKNSQAMDIMGRNVSMLARTMGGDTIGATTALTTAMNSYGISTAKPIQASMTMSRMMDMVAKGAQVGSAEVPQITSAMESLGATASSAGVGFGEAQAALQVLDKYGMKKGAEGGIALRNVLIQLGEGEFMPKQKREAIQKLGVNLQVLGDKTIPLASRLQELSKIQGNSALVSEFFGKENAVAGLAMLQNIGVLKDYTTKIIDSSGATKGMSDIIGSSFSARMARVGAVFANAGIAIFEATKPYLPFIQATGTVLFGLSQMYPALAMVGTGLLWVGKQTLFATLATVRYVGSLLIASLQGLGGLALSLMRVSTWQAIFSLNTYRNIGAMVLQQGATIALTAGTWLFNTALWAAGGGLWAMMSPILVVGAGLVGLGVAVYAVYQNWEWLKGYIYSFGQMLVGVGKFFLTTANPLYWLGQGMMGIMNTFFPSFAGKFFKFWTDLGKWLYDTVKWIWEGVLGFFNSIGKALGFVSEGVDKTMSKVSKMGDIKAGDLPKSMGVEDLNKGLATANDKMKGLGVKEVGATLPATMPTDVFASNIGGGVSASLPNAKTQRGLDGVSGGGSKSTSINITIGKMNETIEIKTTNLTESTTDIEAMFMQLFMRVVNGAGQMDG